MNEITNAQRVYFATLALLALWVGAWGTFAPGEVDRALPWLVPPLHARFLGAIYASAGVMLVAGIFARRHVDVRAMVLVVTIWTGALLVLSLFHLDAFDWRHRPVWFWFAAYVAYPVIGVASWFVHRPSAPRHDDANEKPRMRAPLRRAWFALGIAAIALSIALAAAPSVMAGAWPWKISSLLAQVYSAPFLAYGVGSLWIARNARPAPARLVALGTSVWTALALVASLLHLQLFDPTRVATWVWFGGLALACALASATQVPFLARRSSS